MYRIPPPKEEVLKKYRACCKKLGRTPGLRVFCQLTGLRQGDVYFHWPIFADLVREVGGQPNQLPPPQSDEQIFRDYARVCVHLGRVPGQRELHQTGRQIGARVRSIYRRFGARAEFHRLFRAWLLEAPEEFKPILAMPGWWRAASSLPPLPTRPESVESSWLPGFLRDLETLAEKKVPPGMANREWHEGIFDTRCADAFRALGFQVEERFRPPDRTPVETESFAPDPPRRMQGIAVTPNHTYGVILDCEARPGEYVLPEPGDRALYERVRVGVADLRLQEIFRAYLVCLGPSFRETDLAGLVKYLAGSGLAGVTLLSAAALLRLVEASIRDRASFTLARFESTLVGNNLIL